MAQHPCDAIFIEQVGAVFHFQPDLVPAVGHEEKQVKLGGVALPPSAIRSKPSSPMKEVAGRDLAS